MDISWTSIKDEYPASGKLVVLKYRNEKGEIILSKYLWHWSSRWMEWKDAGDNGVFVNSNDVRFWAYVEP